MIVRRNLLEDHDAVSRIVRDYFRWQRELTRRVMDRRYAARRRGDGGSFSLWDYLRIPRFRSKLPKQMAIKEFADLEEKSHEYYQIASSEFPTHELAELIGRRLSGADFESILKVHELYERRLARFNRLPVIGAGVAVGIFLLANVPDSAATRLFGSVEKFQWGVFGSSVGITIVAAFIFWASYGDYLVEKTRSFRIREILEYLVIQRDHSVVPEIGAPTG